MPDSLERGRAWPESSDGSGCSHSFQTSQGQHGTRYHSTKMSMRDGHWSSRALRNKRGLRHQLGTGTCLEAKAGITLSRKKALTVACHFVRRRLPAERLPQFVSSVRDTTFCSKSYAFR